MATNDKEQETKRSPGRPQELEGEHKRTTVLVPVEDLEEFKKNAREAGSTSADEIRGFIRRYNNNAYNKKRNKKKKASQ